MRFSKSFSKFSYTLAILHGFFIGAISIGLFAILIQWQDITGPETPATPTTEAPQAEDGKETPDKVTVDAPKVTETTPTSFYAKQHGVFTTATGATTFMQTSASLKSSAIIIADEQYYVWSAASSVESEVKTTGTIESFVKPFRINTAACTEPAMQKLPIFLAYPEPAKFNFESTGNQQSIPKDWLTNIAAISTLSEDSNVIRVQLLSHYLIQNDCIKIEF
ncbi:hypothetical protein [Paenisporosarcina sp. TG20]|uniref:hypothetical protein n=1 Tax=Paenisporosarcina sp. TG20 TaxID=1211706 RepID=UPI0002E521B4|nr:hypothetical protein [Paenisporosarcina sp. TG20]